MSSDEHDDHGHGDGAHEIDKMPSRKLFNLLFGLSGLTLAACIGVVQLFNQQVASIQDSRNARVSFQLTEYREEMTDLRDNWGPVWITDDDGVPESERGKGVHEAKRFQMPLAEARKRMLEEPAKYLKAARPYPRWKNPDPLAPQPAAGRRGAMPRGARPQPARPPGGMRLPAKPGAQPTRIPVKPPAEGGAPVPAKPGEGKAPAKPAEGKAPAAPAKPAEGKAPAKPSKPEGKAPAKPAKPDTKGGQ